MQQDLQQAMEQLQPEASYLYEDDGKRAAIFILDMEDPSHLPPVVEPFFQAAAKIHLTPVMTPNDPQKGLQQASAKPSARRAAAVAPPQPPVPRRAGRKG